MSSPTPPTYKTKNWPAYNEALKRRGSLTIWFDPETSWEAAPSGRRGRQQTYSDAAVQTCLTTARQGIAADHRLCREPTATDRHGLDGAGLQHSVPSPENPRREHPLSWLEWPAAPADPLSLLQAATAGQWTAPASRLRAKVSGMRASMAAPNSASGARSTSGSTSKRWRSEPSIAPQVHL